MPCNSNVAVMSTLYGQFPIHPSSAMNGAEQVPWVELGYIYTERFFLPISYFFHVSKEEWFEYAVLRVRVALFGDHSACRCHALVVCV